MSTKRASAGADTYMYLYSDRRGFRRAQRDVRRTRWSSCSRSKETRCRWRTSMVTVNAATMAKEIAKAGQRHPLRHLFRPQQDGTFKPESANTIGEIVKFLKSDPKILVYIVGHTDNVGGYEYNLGLSQRRTGGPVVRGSSDEQARRPGEAAPGGGSGRLASRGAERRRGWARQESPGGAGEAVAARSPRVPGGKETVPPSMCRYQLLPAGGVAALSVSRYLPAAPPSRVL